MRQFFSNRKFRVVFLPHHFRLPRLLKLFLSQNYTVDQDTTTLTRYRANKTDCFIPNSPSGGTTFKQFTFTPLNLQLIHRILYSTVDMFPTKKKINIKKIIITFTFLQQHPRFVVLSIRYGMPYIHSTKSYAQIFADELGCAFASRISGALRARSVRNFRVSSVWISCTVAVAYFFILSDRNFDTNFASPE